MKEYFFNNLYVISLDGSDIEHDQENKSLIIHGGVAQIKYYDTLKDLQEAIDNKKWIIYKVFSKAEKNDFTVGEICFPLEINKSENYGSLYRVLSQNGKSGWVHSNCLRKITKDIKIIQICECLD